MLLPAADDITPTATTLVELLDARAAGAYRSWACAGIKHEHDPVACPWCTESFFADVAHIALGEYEGAPPAGLRLYNAVLNRCLVERVGFRASIALGHEFAMRHKPSLAN